MHFKKISALLLTLAICFACFSFETVFATKTLINSVSTNNDFAKNTAEIIKNENEDSMLRIIGKFSKTPPYSVFSSAEEAIISKDGRFVLQFSTEKALVSCLKNLNKHPNIIYAERDRLIYTEALEPGNEYLSWGVSAIEADIYSQKIASSDTDGSVVVAIVDSGTQNIDFLKEKLIPGYDFYENDSDAFQDKSVDSHGTFLASIVADCTHGIPVKIMPVRVLNSKNGSLINAINGITYAVDNGADVINISLGGALTNCRALEDAIGYAESQNVTVVVCAGNSQRDMMEFCPAHVESAITVSSIDQDFSFSQSYSNFGDGIDFAAPGENITGYNAAGETVTMSGTSMSTAFVSAAAAMFLLENPDCSTAQIHSAMVACSKDCGDLGWDKYYGHGIPQLSEIEKQSVIPVESVTFPQKIYTLTIGDMIEIEPIFYPEDSTDKSFTLSAENSNISVDRNTVTAISAGTSSLTLISGDGEHSDTAEIIINTPVSESTTVEETETSTLVEETTTQVEETTAQVEETTAQVEETTAQVEETTTQVEETTTQVEKTTAQIEKTTTKPVIITTTENITTEPSTNSVETTNHTAVTVPSTTVPSTEPSTLITGSIRIRNNLGNRTINYGEILRLTAEITDKPENSSVWWFVDEVKSGEGETFEISPKSGSVEITVKLVDVNGTVITDDNGNELSDSQTISVKSGFFQKLISFFKNLFGIDRTVVQLFIKN